MVVQQSGSASSIGFGSLSTIGHHNTISGWQSGCITLCFWQLEIEAE
jgi:hypothetical protein